MAITASVAVFAVGSGGIVGAILGLMGSGGSILAVPLLVYVVGVSSPHIAIGTSAIAVALNAAFGLVAHARLGMVKWRRALVFSAAGMAGAALGAEFGKAIDGQKLLSLFGIAMVAVGLAMLRAKTPDSTTDGRLTRETAAHLLPRLLGIGLTCGVLAGFFGIGGGFLIVPGLMLATGIPLANAVGSSLLAVTAFGLTTAGSYAFSGFVDWTIASMMIGGGIAGSFLGARLNRVMAGNKRLMIWLFAGIVILVGSVIFVRGFHHIIGS